MRIYLSLVVILVMFSTIGLAYVTAQVTINGNSETGVINLEDITKVSGGSGSNVTSVSGNGYIIASPTTGDVVVTLDGSELNNTINQLATGTENTSWNQTYANDLYVNIGGDNMTGALGINCSEGTGNCLKITSNETDSSTDALLLLKNYNLFYDQPLIKLIYNGTNYAGYLDCSRASEPGTTGCLFIRETKSGGDGLKVDSYSYSGSAVHIRVINETENDNSGQDGLYVEQVGDGSLATAIKVKAVSLGRGDAFTYEDNLANKLFFIDFAGNLTTTGNITADYYYGDGSKLTGISGGNTSWNQTFADSKYVNKAGDTMTGQLVLNPTSGNALEWQYGGAPMLKFDTTYAGFGIGYIQAGTNKDVCFSSDDLAQRFCLFDSSSVFGAGYSDYVSSVGLRYYIGAFQRMAILYQNTTISNLLLAEGGIGTTNILATGQVLAPNLEYKRDMNMTKVTRSLDTTYQNTLNDDVIFMGSLYFTMYYPDQACYSIVAVNKTGNTFGASTYVQHLGWNPMGLMLNDEGAEWGDHRTFSVTIPKDAYYKIITNIVDCSISIDETWISDY